MTFKQNISAELTRQGRKRQWLADQMGISRITLWRKLTDKKLSKEEKEKILSLLKS
jgi:DNA-binding NtrC family response regulator